MSCLLDTENVKEEASIPQTKSLLEYKLTSNIDDNILILKDVFFNDDTLSFQVFENQFSGRFCLVIVDGLANHEVISKNILQPLFELTSPLQGDINKALMKSVIQVDEMKQTEDFEVIVDGVVSGDAVLLVDGCNSALVIRSKGWTIRSVAEPPAETVARGPREGFTESLMVNLGLIRRKIRTNDIKFKFKTLGSRTKSKVCLVYLDQVVNKEILRELMRRLDSFDLDGAIGSGYIEEFMIKDSPYTPFHTVGTTERPDTVAGKLLEGRIAIFLDGTPVVLTVPYIFIEMFQVNEDYYNNYIYASLMRIIRLVGFFFSTLVPALYIAIITYHQEIIPANLLISIVSSRTNVPFPSILELSIMLLIFEILREAGARMPSNIGSALSIVGALVLGQAAVEARLVSAPIIIIVGLTGICSLLIMNELGAIIIIRVLLLIGATAMGMYGLIGILIGIMVHLFSLRSFGVPYMLNLTSARYQDIKDLVIRGPWFAMRTRPKFITWNSRRNGR